MQYSYTSEQSEFKDSLRKFVQDNYDYEARREYVKSDTGYRADLWQQLAELGVLGLPFAEAYGGLETDLGYLMAVADEFGRGLVLEPVFASVALAGRLLAAGDNEALKAEVLPQLVAGECILAAALDDKASRGNPLAIALTATAEGENYVLSGVKHAVLAGPQADKILVSAKDGQGAVKLFLIDAAVEGITATHYTSVDGSRASNLQFENVAVAASASLFSGDAAAALQTILDEAVLVLAAEAVGAMDQLLQICQDYMKTRKQFGMPLAAFQALQHRLADMYIGCERLRSLMWAGLQAVGSDELGLAAAMLKAELGKSGRYVGQQAIQLHGGIGMTDELNVGAYFKRLTAMELLLGNRDYHLGRIVAGRAA